MDRLDREIINFEKSDLDYLSSISDHEIGIRLKNLLKMHNVTQREFADVMGDWCTEDMVSNWIRGKSSISSRDLAVMARLFQTSIDYLVTGRENKQRLFTFNDFENLSMLEAAKILLIDIPRALPAKYEMKNNILTYSITCDRYVGPIFADIAKRLQYLKDAEISPDAYKVAGRDIIGSYLDFSKLRKNDKPIPFICLMPISIMGKFEPIDSNNIQENKLCFDDVE